MDEHEWDRRYSSAELVWGAAPNRFVVDVVSALPAGNALDIAAGEGRNAVWLAEQGWNVTATEFSTVAIDSGRRIAAERGVTVDWVHADARSDPPRTRHYDLVLLAYLHLKPEDWARALVQAVRALAPGGLLVSLGHDRANLVHGVGGPPDAEILHDAQEIERDIAAAATESATPMTVRSAERVERPVTGEGEERTAIDTLVVAVRDRTTP